MRYVKAESGIVSRIIILLMLFSVIVPVSYAYGDELLENASSIESMDYQHDASIALGEEYLFSLDISELNHTYNRSNIELLHSEILYGEDNKDISNNTIISQKTVNASFIPEETGRHNHSLGLDIDGVNQSYDVSFEVLDLEESENVSYSTANISGRRFDLITDDVYYYNPDDATLNFSMVSYDTVDEYTVGLASGPDQRDSRSHCNKNITGNSSFDCALPRSLIDISDYSIEGNITYGNDTEYFDESFRLSLPDPEDFSINLDHENFINFTETQEIYVEPLISGDPAHDTEMHITVESPDGSTTTFDKIFSEDSGPISYIPEQTGIHKISVMSTYLGQYTEIGSQFRVLEDDVNMSLEVPSRIMHNYGRLNITGNLTITDSQGFLSENVSLYYARPDRGKSELCEIGCNGFCEFSCSTEGIMEYSDYNITAVMEYHGREYRDDSMTEIDFDERDIEFDFTYSDEYHSEEVQNFFLSPEYAGETLETGSVFAEIIDPSGIVYRITPERVFDGYSFSFVGIEPGKYDINITYVSDIGYRSESYNYTVLEERADIDEDERRAEIDRDRAVRDVLDEDVLDSFNSTDDDNMMLQLPASLDEKVRWVVLSRNISSLDDHSAEKDIAIIPESLEKLELSNHIPGNIYDDFRMFDLYYAESEEIGYSKDVVSDDLMRVVFDKGYDDVTLDIALDGISRTERQNILVYRGSREDDETVKDIRYDIERGMVASLEFFQKNLSEEYEIVILSDEPSFYVDAPERTDIGKSTIIEVNYLNPDVGIEEEGLECDVVLDGVTHPMVPSSRRNAFTKGIRFNQTGNLDYKVFCGSESSSEEIVVRGRQQPESFSESSSSIRTNESRRLSMSYNSPQNHYRDGEWHAIDTTFEPELRNDTLEYVADKGRFTASMSDIGKDMPFSYSYEGNEIKYGISYIALYNASSSEYISKIFPSNDSVHSGRSSTVTYESIFGDGTDLIFTNKNSELRKELVIDKDVFDIGVDGSEGDDIKVMTRYLLELDELRMDEQTTTGIIPIRTQDYMDSGIYLSRDYYYPYGNESARRVMQRNVEEISEGTYALSSTISSDDYRSMDGKIVLDPTFSIGDNDRDAMSIGNTTVLDYYDEDSQYLFFGNGEDVYKTGLQFQLDVPFGADITDSYLMLTSGENSTGENMNISIETEDSTDVSPFIEGSGNLSERNYLEEGLLWEIDSDWDFGESYETPDISSMIQEIVDDPSWSSGNHIGFMLSSDDDAYRSIHGHSSPGDNLPVLVVAYESEQGEPDVYLDEPEDGEFLSDDEITFSFIPEDEDELDYCELWGDFSGDWRLNQTMEDVDNGSVNSFDPVALDQGEYLWNVWCSDVMGNAGFNESNSEFTVDRDSPSISLDYPVSEEVDELNLEFLFTPSDPVADNLSCSLRYHEDGFLVDEIQDIDATPNEQEGVLVEDFNVGEFTWNVTCEDDAGNTGTSSTEGFTVSRDSSLDGFTDAELDNNVSLYEMFSAYSNYTNGTDDTIEDASCSISSDGEDEAMVYDGDKGLYVANISYSSPYENDYDIECESDMYDTSSFDGSLYIYPIIDSGIEKEVESIDDSAYKISLLIHNDLNTSAFSRPIEFVHESFSADFSIEPDHDESFLGHFPGTSYRWDILLEADESLEISYNVTPSSYDFFASDLYISGLEAYME